MSEIDKRKKANERVSQDVHQKAILSKWVSMEGGIPFAVIQDVGDGWGMTNANFFDFSGGQPPEDFLIAFGMLVATLEKKGTMKRPYRVILVAGPIPSQESQAEGSADD